VGVIRLVRLEPDAVCLSFSVVPDAEHYAKHGNHAERNVCQFGHGFLLSKELVPVVRGLFNLAPRVQGDE